MLMQGTGSNSPLPGLTHLRLHLFVIVLTVTRNAHVKGGSGSNSSGWTVGQGLYTRSYVVWTYACCNGRQEQEHGVCLRVDNVQ